MSIQQDIEAHYKEAFKANERDIVSALRMLKSVIKNREIELGRELTEAETVEVIGRELKHRREAARQYTAGGRPELAAREESEATLYQHYLPAQLSAGELERLVSQTVGALGSAGPRDVGKVMAALMPKVKGRADGAAVQTLVRRALGG